MRDSISQFIGVAMLIAVVLSAPLLAHHSVAAEYDSNKPVAMTGTVTRIDWVNPHAWLYVAVKGPDGQVVTWKVEMAGVNRLVTIGFRKDTIALSSSVTVQAWPARDGSPHASGRILTLPDGTQFDVHDTFPQNPQVK